MSNNGKDKLTLTAAQDKAIHEPGNIIVSAGAGSGKTFVMIQRILDKLKKGEAKLDEMLVVTYMRAAASEMKYKLAEKLMELRRDKKYLKIAEDAIERMPCSNIGTMHSFCQRLIKRYFYVAGIDPAATVDDEKNTEAIKAAAVSAAVEKAAADKSNTAFSSMYEMLYTRQGDDEVKRTVGRILDFALSTSDPEGYLLGGKPDEKYFSELDGLIAPEEAELTAEIAALKQSLIAEKMEKHAAVIDEFKDKMHGVIDDITRTSISGKKTAVQEILNEQYKALKARCVKFADKYKEVQLAKSVRGYEYSQALCAVALDAMNRFNERKKKLGIIDYSDMEHGAYRVLKDPDCIKEISRGIKYVFIDEFQDVNPLQSDIVDCLRVAAKETFVVGDVKQSIFGFRRCSPEHFIRAINSGNYTHIPLTDNFRSSRPVIDFVNKVFDGVMTADFGGVDYSDPRQRLVCGSGVAEGAAHYVVIPKEEKEKSDDDMPFEPYSVKKDAQEVKHNAEAVFIAKTVCKLLISHNPPELGKIAILVSSFKSCAKDIIRELEERNVKVGLDKKLKAKSFSEVVGLVDILRCIDNRYDDIALFTALRSPMGGFSDEELLDISRSGGAVLSRRDARPLLGADKPYTLWEKLSAYDGGLKERVDKFIALRKEFCEFALDHDCADTLGEITAKIDYFQYVYERGLSAQAVDSIIEVAADRNCDTHVFLKYFDKSDLEIEMGAGGDAVSLITEHSSKGLEYDYVIVADTSKGFNEQDVKQRVLVSERGVFVKIPDRENSTLIKTAPWMVEKVRMPERLRAEALRLFYVALTRAKKCLIVCSRSNVCHDDVKNSTCPAEFMRNIAPTPIDENDLPADGMGVSAVILPPDRKITNAVKERIDSAEHYNAERISDMTVSEDGALAPIKTCVTSVAHGADETDYTFTAPVLTIDVPEGDGDALARGTAYHRAMELIDFESPDASVVEERCDDFELVDKNILLRAAEDMKQLTAGAEAVAKERYFIVDLPLNKVYGKGDGNVLVQGVIDLLILYGDKTATIVDYKTGDPASFNYAAYSKQLELYKEAVERTTDYKVTAAYLYSLYAGKFLEYPEFNVK